MKAIIKGIEAPTPNAKHWNAKYPANMMEVGDCFEHDGDIQMARVYAACTSARKHPMKFIAGIHEGRVMVWRTA